MLLSANKCCQHQPPCRLLPRTLDSWLAPLGERKETIEQQREMELCDDVCIYRFGSIFLTACARWQHALI